MAQVQLRHFPQFTPETAAMAGSHAGRRQRAILLPVIEQPAFQQGLRARHRLRQMRLRGRMLRQQQLP